MRKGDFLRLVEDSAGITREQAEQAIRATLTTLAERITRGQAEDIAAFLPREFQGFLTSAPEPAEPFGLDEFLRRVAERERVDQLDVYKHVHAVFAALGQAVGQEELDDMAAQLSSDFEPLVDAALSDVRELPPLDPLVRRVAQLASLDPGAARRVTESVLEVLAIRISDGEVEDLMERLPPDLRPALERGLARSRKATRMSLAEFLTLVARRDGVNRDEAERRARAVFTALRELLPDKEFYDVSAELPGEYALLLSGFA
jgi:uncharacterized protein (DUF2267 family)